MLEIRDLSISSGRANYWFLNREKPIFTLIDQSDLMDFASLALQHIASMLLDIEARHEHQNGMSVHHGLKLTTY
jgi:hypothetical protein